MDMGEVRLFPLLRLGHHLEHHRHGKHVIDLLALDQLDDLRGVVEALEKQGAARVDYGRRRGDQRPDVEQRSDDQGLVGVVDAVSHERMNGAEQDVPVREHGALRVARRSRCVHDKEGVVVRHLADRDGLIRRKARDEIGQRRVFRQFLPAVPEVARNGKPGGLDGLHLLGKIRGVDQRPGGAVPENVDQLRRREAKVDGHHDCARLAAGEKNLQELAGVEHQGGNPLPLDDAQIRQGVGHAIDPLVEHSVVELPPVLILQEGPTGMVQGSFGYPLTDIHANPPAMLQPLRKRDR